MPGKWEGIKASKLGRPREIFGAPTKGVKNIMDAEVDANGPNTRSRIVQRLDEGIPVN
jgi:hypothetical protein